MHHRHSLIQLLHIQTMSRLRCRSSSTFKTVSLAQTKNKDRAGGVSWRYWHDLMPIIAAKALPFMVVWEFLKVNLQSEREVEGARFIYKPTASANPWPACASCCPITNENARSQLCACGRSTQSHQSDAAQLSLVSVQKERNYCCHIKRYE